MQYFTKVELGRIAIIIAGAVWIGTLQGTINSFDKNEIRKEKKFTLIEMEKRLELISEKNIKLEKEYKNRIKNFKNSLSTINSNLNDLNDLIKYFQRINSSDNREIIMKLEENMELIQEKIQKKEIELINKDMRGGVFHESCPHFNT